MTIAYLDPARLKSRTKQLGLDAVQGTRELSDLFGDALSELRNVHTSMMVLRAELQEKEEAVAALTAQLEAARAQLAEQVPPSRAREETSATADLADGVDLPLPVLGRRELAVAVDLFEEPVPDDSGALSRYLRARLEAGLSLGTLRGGDRLPGIRELARRSGINHKVVGREYRALEQEALVEVRDRSGIYVSAPTSYASPDLDETERWAAGIVFQAVELGQRVTTLPDLLRGCTRARVLRCACVVSTEDDRVSLCRGVGDQFGMSTTSVSGTSPDLAGEISDADLVVTTPFDAVRVRSALRPGQPLVVADLHPFLNSTLRASTDDDARVLICADPIWGERLLHGMGASTASRVRLIRAEDAVRGGGLQECRGVATPAAWERLGGGDPPENLTVLPWLSPRTARDLATALVGLNRASLKAAGSSR
jgi:DNA-binding transcriptional regulator YhcF (GntR family)